MLINCFFKTFDQTFFSTFTCSPSVVHEPLESKYNIQIPKNLFKLFSFKKIMIPKRNKTFLGLQYGQYVLGSENGRIWRILGPKTLRFGEF